MYINVVVNERAENVLLQQEQMILKTKMRLQMDIGRRGILSEYKYLFNKSWGKLWYLPGKYKKIWLRDMTVGIKCGKRRRYI